MFDEPFPYCLTLNYAYVDDRIYIHCAPVGHKLDCILKNPYVAFTMAVDLKIDCKNSTEYYKSVCGTGMATIVEEKGEKQLALDSIARKYNALCAVPATERDIARTAIIRIDIASLFGKHSSPPPDFVAE